MDGRRRTTKYAGETFQDPPEAFEQDLSGLDFMSAKLLDGVGIKLLFKKSLVFPPLGPPAMRSRHGYRIPFFFSGLRLS